jgi:transcriptional regulator with XRE-family HTH domain
MAPSAPETIGARLRYVRSLSGISASALSDLAGLSPAHVGLIEHDRVSSPVSLTLEKLSVTLGVDLHWLITGAGRKPTKVIVQRAVAAARDKATKPTEGA